LKNTETKVKFENRVMLMHRICGNLSRMEFCRHAIKFVERKKKSSKDWLGEQREEWLNSS